MRRRPRSPESRSAAGRFVVASSLVAAAVLAASAAATGQENAPPPEDAERPAPQPGPPSDEESPADPIDRIRMAGLQEAFRALRQRYIHRERLDATELNRAALQGVLERLDFGAILDTGNEPPGPEATYVFASSALPDRTAYLRPVRLDTEEFQAIDEALAGFRERGSETLILDLRAPFRTAGFEAAARLADRFLPANQPIFRVVQTGADRPRLFFSRQSPSWERGLVVLVDGETGPAGEAAAAVLRRETGCFLVGAATPGRTVEYDTVAIGEGLTLRIAVAELILPDESSLFRVGLKPDFAVDTPGSSKEAFFDSSDVAAFLFETQRPRLNEAALVEGANPELPYLLARSRGEATAFDTAPVVDKVVQRVFDLLTTDRFLARPEPAPPEDEDENQGEGETAETSGAETGESGEIEVPDEGEEPSSDDDDADSEGKADEVGNDGPGEAEPPGADDATDESVPPGQGETGS